MSPDRTDFHLSGAIQAEFKAAFHGMPPAGG